MSRSLSDYATALTVASLAALGGAAIVFSEIDDAPGGILVGLLRTGWIAPFPGPRTEAWMSPEDDVAAYRTQQPITG